MPRAGAPPPGALLDAIGRGAERARTRARSSPAAGELFLAGLGAGAIRRGGPGNADGRLPARPTRWPASSPGWRSARSSLLSGGRRVVATSLDAAAAAETPSARRRAGAGAVRRAARAPARLANHANVGGVSSRPAATAASPAGWCCWPTGSRRQQFMDRLRGRFLAGGSWSWRRRWRGGLVFSRRLSRPLRDIAAAASDIAAGDLALQLPVRGSAEAVTVAQAFNDMSASLRVGPRSAGARRHPRPR